MGKSVVLWDSTDFPLKHHQIRPDIYSMNQYRHLSFPRTNEAREWEPDTREIPAEIDYPKEQQLFNYISEEIDLALLKKRSDGSIWILEITDILDEDGEFKDYIYHIEVKTAPHWDEWDEYPDEDRDSDSFVNIATDLYKAGLYESSPMPDSPEFTDLSEKTRLFRVDTEEVAEYMLYAFALMSKHRPGLPKRSRDRMKMNTNAVIAIHRAFPDL